VYFLCGALNKTSSINARRNAPNPAPGTPASGKPSGGVLVWRMHAARLVPAESSARNTIETVFCLRRNHISASALNATSQQITNGRRVPVERDLTIPGGQKKEAAIRWAAPSDARPPVYGPDGKYQGLVFDYGKTQTYTDRNGHFTGSAINNGNETTSYFGPRGNFTGSAGSSIDRAFNFNKR